MQLPKSVQTVLSMQKTSRYELFPGCYIPKTSSAFPHIGYVTHITFNSMKLSTNIGNNVFVSRANIVYRIRRIEVDRNANKATLHSERFNSRPIFDHVINQCSENPTLIDFTRLCFGSTVDSHFRLSRLISPKLERVDITDVSSLACMVPVTNNLSLIITMNHRFSHE